MRRPLRPLRRPLRRPLSHPHRALSRPAHPAPAGSQREQHPCHTLPAHRPRSGAKTASPPATDQHPAQSRGQTPPQNPRAQPPVNPRKSHPATAPTCAAHLLAAHMLRDRRIPSHPAPDCVCCNPPRKTSRRPRCDTRPLRSYPPRDAAPVQPQTAPSAHDPRDTQSSSLLPYTRVKPLQPLQRRQNFIPRTIHSIRRPRRKRLQHRLTRLAANDNPTHHNLPFR